MRYALFRIWQTEGRGETLAGGKQPLPQRAQECFVVGQPAEQKKSAVRLLHFCLTAIGLCVIALRSANASAAASTLESVAQTENQATAQAEADDTWRPLRRTFALGERLIDVLVWIPPGIAQNEAIGAIRRAQRWAEQLMLTFDEADERRALWRLQEQAGRGSVVLPPEVYHVLSEAKRIALLSNGAYDPTAAALGKLWDVRQCNCLPPKDVLETALSKTSATDLWLEPASRSARLTQVGQTVSIAPLAVAYAMDGVASRLVDRGFSHYLIQSDGGVLVGEGPPGRHWRLGLQDPRAPGHFALWEVSAGALMTTGDYFHFVVLDQKRVHNVVDPRTGTPANTLRSVSLRAKTALEAKALSQAFFVLGPEEGSALLARLQDGEAVWVDAQNRVGMSESIQEKLTYRPPTDGI